MIGQWVSRWSADGDAVRRTRWHLVESEIDDRKVVRCGRQMGFIASTELAWTDAPQHSERCYYCRRKRVIEPATPGDEPLDAG
jgi:hypothetical protein